MLSVHTSPLDAPGGGDAGGLNVYVVETAKRLADVGVAVEIFTRATSSELPATVTMHPGVLVRHVTAGPFEGLGKADLPAQLCAFTAAVLRTEAQHEPGWYDLIHSHYWLSGQAGWLASERWGVPLVHTAHTLGKVKNSALADGDGPEPLSRIIGEQQVVAAADRLVASTAEEGRQLVELYGADPAVVATVPPGVDIDSFAPGSGADVRGQLGLSPDDLMLLFVGRIQALKAPDVLLRAVAGLRALDPVLGGRVKVVIVGAPSGSGLADPRWLAQLVDEFGLGDAVHFVDPVARAELPAYYCAADLTVVPSYSESFGLVALESQSCGTPVVAAAVGGLSTAVVDGVTGALVYSHEPGDWAQTLLELLRAPDVRRRFSAAARLHAFGFSWERTVEGLLVAYREALDGVHSPLSIRRRA